MKGRRRARRTALQALYELDQSQHGLETVLAGRMRDFVMTGAPGTLGDDESDVLAHIVDGAPPGTLPDLAPADIAERFGLDDGSAERVSTVLSRQRPHAEYCVTIVRGVVANREPLDDVIARIAPEWPVDQMAPVDRNVLRIALWEIGSGTSPVRVAINEAVELARAFSGEGARRMVNGALGAYTSGEPRLSFAPRRS